VPDFLHIQKAEAGVAVAVSVMDSMELWLAESKMSSSALSNCGQNVITYVVSLFAGNEYQTTRTWPDLLSMLSGTDKGVASGKKELEPRSYSVGRNADHGVK
jgi:hypothetical protein